MPFWSIESLIDSGCKINHILISATENVYRFALKIRYESVKIVLFFFGSLLSTIAVAQRQHPIDVAFDKCTSAYQNNPNYGGEPGPGRHCDAEAVKAWNEEMDRLAAKVPGERSTQAAWVEQRDKHIAEMSAKFTIPGVGLSTTGTDEIRWYQIDVTRKRVLQLTKLAQEESFVLPKE